MTKLKKVKKTGSTWEGSYKAKVYDAESDPLNCHFSGDGCIHINTKGYSYLELTVDNLHEMINLIEEAEEKLSKED